MLLILGLAIRIRNRMYPRIYEPESKSAIWIDICLKLIFKASFDRLFCNLLNDTVVVTPFLQKNI